MGVLTAFKSGEINDAVATLDEAGAGVPCPAHYLIFPCQTHVLPLEVLAVNFGSLLRNRLLPCPPVVDWLPR